MPKPEKSSISARIRTFRNARHIPTVFIAVVAGMDCRLDVPLCETLI
jgi:hypothetical protein